MSKLSRRTPVWIAAAGVALSAAAVQATITFTKTIVAEPATAFDKGVEFPLLGLDKAAPTYISARVYKWVQRPDDMFVLEPTTDFSVYPELLRMAANSRKSVTIKAAHPLPTDAELHYRIVLREFDRPDGTNAPTPDNEAAFAVAIRPQGALPLIVRGPASLVPAPMAIQGLRDAPSAAEPHRAQTPFQLLTVRNPGQIYQKIAAIGVNQPAGAANQRLGYVLPGQTIDLPLKVKHGDKIEILYVIGPDAKLDITGKVKDDRKVASYIVP